MMNLLPSFNFDDCYCRVDDVGKNIVRAAKHIIINQQTDQTTTTTEQTEVEKLQRNFDSKFAKVETKMESIEKKLDMLLRNTTKY